MWKVSKYIVSVPQGKDVIVFNTFTSSLILLEQELYNKIFVRKEFDDLDGDVLKSLIEMSYLVDAGLDEGFQLETIRTRGRYYDSDIRMITIAPTLACNARCYYCYEQGIEFSMMSRETADVLVDFLDKHCPERKLTLTWFGGEPLMARDMMDYISRLLLSRGIEILSVITTNGYLIDDEVIEKSKTYWNIRRFQITIDDIGDAYNQIKAFVEPGNAFERVTGNIEKLLQNDIKVNIRINFDPNHIEGTLKTIDYLQERFGKYPCFFMYVAAINDMNVESVLNGFEDKREHPYLTLLRKMKDLGFLCPTSLSDELETKFDDEETLRYLNLRSRPIACYATCLNKFVVDPEGNFYKCHRLLGRGEKFICGNIYEGIKYNQAYKMFVDGKLSSHNCDSCSLLPMCQGGCKVKAMFYGEDQACIANKTIMDSLVRLLAEEMMK